MSPFFFPSPKPGPEAYANPYYGHAVNLTSVDKENDYKIGVELLHPRLDYRPEHIFRTGVISKPFSMPLECARSFHLPWLRLNKDRDDFGRSSNFSEQP
jgi:hypothetical protein